MEGRGEGGGQSARQRDEVTREVVGACMRRSSAHPSVVVSVIRRRAGWSRGSAGFVVHGRVPSYCRRLVRKAPDLSIPAPPRPAPAPAPTPTPPGAPCGVAVGFARPSRSPTRVNYDVNEATGVAGRESLTYHPSPLRPRGVQDEGEKRARRSPLFVSLGLTATSTSTAGGRS